MTWAEDKIKECIAILRKKIRRGKEWDAIDLAEDALWSKNVDVRDARGYLEAWADVADMTVGTFITFVESGRRLDDTTDDDDDEPYPYVSRDSGREDFHSDG